MPVRTLLARLHLTRPEIADGIEPAPAPAGRLPLNTVCRPSFWDDDAWMQTWRDLGLQLDESRYHRKGFEWCQLAYGLERLGALRRDATVVGVGAGHERTLYWLTRHVRRVIATDLYAGRFTTTLAGEADPAFLTDPDRFAPFAYDRSRLHALPASGLALPFRSGSVDVVYSLSAIEHFGGHAAAAQAMQEMARVLKPGGIACVATELILEGGVHEEYFTADELVQHVVRSNGLVLVEPLDLRPPPRTYIEHPVWLPHVEVTPHLVLAIGALRWTSVVVFLRKPTTIELARAGGSQTLARIRRRGAQRSRFDDAGGGASWNRTSDLILIRDAL